MRYAELHAKTNFSFLEGASHAEELARRAAELGYRALAVTDRNSLAGVVRAHMAAKDCGLPLIIGAEITPLDAPPVVLWATDRAAYGRLCRLITRGRRQAPKGECALKLEDVAEFAEGLIAGVVGESREPKHCGFRISDCGMEDIIRNPQSEIRNYADIFPDRCYLLAELHRGADDAARLAALQQLSKQTRVPLVAAGDVHYHVPGRMVLHDVLTAIRHGTTVAAAEGALLFPNAERHLRSLDEIRALFAAAPDAIARTAEIADRCRFSLDELRYEYPTELAPKGQTPLQYLTQLAWQGMKERYPAGAPEKVRRQIEHELELIGELHYESYFLTVWDLVRFARSRNTLCQGRGSAANSAVCFCLGVTSVDPATSDLLFERFVSRERDEAPDIDIDFEHERREEVLQYLYEKYGRERAGLAATVITYCSRSAVRDVGKALGLSLDRVDALAKQVEGYRQEPKLVQRCREVGIDPASDLGRRLVYCVNAIIGFPRHLSQHVGGMIITQGPLCELVPIENAAMEGRTVIEWDKDDLDELGILKVDCLCLGMLTAIHKCFDLVAKHHVDKNGARNLLPERPAGCFAQKVPGTVFGPDHGRELTLATIPPDDPAVYDMICRADTLGVFQIESRAQMSMLPRLRPRCFYDLVIEVAIVRPGPIQGNMVHPFLRRRMGEEEETYPNDAIREVLHKTLGVPIFQEQAMRLAVVAAGFTPGEADQLRRAMAAWRRPGLIDQFRKKLLDGMRANGLPDEFAQRVYQQIQGFGEYGFPESHAASFALLVYASAWLKHYYPAAFCAAMINSQPLGFYAPAQLVRDARDHGVEVLPVDVNASGWDCRLESQEMRVESREPENFGFRIVDCGFIKSNPQSAIRNPQSMSLRLGLRIIRGLRREDAAAIERAREAGPFVSMDDFARRTGLGQAVIKRLAEADAFSSLGANRRQALWESLGQERNRVSQPLFDLLPLSLQHDALSLSHDAGAISGSRNAAKVNSQGRQPLENENIETEAPKGRQTLTNCHDNHQGLTPLAIDCRPFGSNRQQTHHAKEGEGRGVSLPPMPQYEEVVADYRAVGLSLKAHPISFYRQQLEQLKITPAQGLLELANGAKVTVAGLVLLRQRPSTAKGITFVTLEDETGTVNLVVHQQTWDRFYRIARRAPAWIAHGHLQTTGAMPSLAPTCSREAIDRDRERGHDSASREHATSVIHVVVSRLEALGDQLRKLDVKSRDFR